MNAENRDGYSCPSLTDLSAWHDSELHDRALEQHVANCPRCLRLLQSFRVIDGRAVAEVSLDPAALQRIKCHCIREIRQQPRWFRTSVVLRLAALLALVGLVMYFRGRLVPSEFGAAPTLASAERAPAKARQARLLAARQVAPAPAGTAPAEALMPGASTALAMDSLPEETDDASGVPAEVRAVPAAPPMNTASAMRLVGYEAGMSAANNDERPRVLAAAPAAGASRVSSCVNHVWLVEETAAPLRDLSVMAPSQRAELSRLEEEHRQQYLVRLLLSDKELATLVDVFAAKGYKLLSPDAPQPGGAAALTFTGRQVEYDLTIVQK